MRRSGRNAASRSTGRHKQYPQLPLDNNTAERALRGPVIGRKNYYGSGSVASAQLASRVWTITATAERAGLNVLTYLHSYLEACAQAGGKPPDTQTLTRFLPWAADPADLNAWRRSRTAPPDTDTAADTDTEAGPAP
jgi:transposase